MTEKEMIEEMYNLFLNYKYGKVDWKKFDCIEKDFFEFLYNAGYRNCKDKVVLSKEEYVENLYSQFKDGYKQARKKMAKEIFEKVLSYIGSNQKFCIVDNDNQTLIDCDKLWEFVGILAKQYGVEVEE